MKKVVDFVFVVTILGSALAIAAILIVRLEAEKKTVVALRSQIEEQTAEAENSAERVMQRDALARLREQEVQRLRPIRTVRGIIVHHSDSPFGDVPQVDAWHRQRGFSEVGYHYVICNGQGDADDGEIQFGRNEDIQGAHARASNRNAGTLGVCLIGKDTFTSAQVRSLKELLVHLCQRHNLAPSAQTIQGHHEQCPGPGLNLEAIIAEVAKEIATIQ